MGIEKSGLYAPAQSSYCAPIPALRDAMSKYPERCTAVGLRLHEDSALELFTPYGLEDILKFFKFVQLLIFRESRPNGSLSNTIIQEKLAGEMEKFDF